MNKVTLWLVAIFLVGASAIAGAQQPKKIYHIGYLSQRTGNDSRDEAFRQGLHEAAGALRLVMRAIGMSA